METAQGRRRRLPRQERERLILEEAVRFFAEVGFEGQTRILAERLGVTQPLLYRYFPDKDTLIQRVFDEVYLKRWNADWEELLRDRSRPLVDRVTDFYKNYCRAIFEPEWVRIFMFAGLKGESMNTLFLDNIGKKVVEPVCIELRKELALPPPEAMPITELEINLGWGMHAAIVHIAQRKWIFGLTVPDNLDELIEYTVETYMSGAHQTVKRLVESQLAGTETRREASVA